MTIVIERMDPGSEPARKLVGKLDGYLLDLYPPESNHLDCERELAQSHVHFLVAFEDDRAIGCGAIKLLEGYAEIKRIYLEPGLRGKGTGSRILSQLESIARGAGIGIVRLETGARQPEALHLFRNNGYARTGRYGEYPDDPLSVFMLKTLHDETR